MRQKQETIECLIYGELNKNENKLKNFLEFLFYNKRLKYQDILKTPFFKLDLETHMTKILPLSSMPSTYGKSKTYFKNNSFSIHLKLPNTSETLIEIRSLFETFKQLITQNETKIYFLYVGENDIIPNIYKINKNEFININANLDKINQEELRFI